MLSTQTTVKCVNKQSELFNKRMVVYRNAGDESDSGDIIPEGWVECVYEASLTLQKELFREENLEISEI